MLKNPRMTFDDVLDDMRAHGMKMGKDLLTLCFNQGIFPFCHIITHPKTGNIQYLILRKDYENWSREYLYLEEPA